MKDLIADLYSKKQIICLKLDACNQDGVGLGVSRMHSFSPGQPSFLSYNVPLPS